NGPLPEPVLAKNGAWVVDRAWFTALAYPMGLVPGLSPMSYWAMVSPAGAPPRVCQLVSRAGWSLPWGSNTSPAIRTVSGLPAAVMVVVPPTDRPVWARKAVLTSASPGPRYQRPRMMSYPVQAALPRNASVCTGWVSPGTVIWGVASATYRRVPGC